MIWVRMDGWHQRPSGIYLARSQDPPPRLILGLQTPHPPYPPPLPSPAYQAGPGEGGGYGTRILVVVPGRTSRMYRINVGSSDAIKGRRGGLLNPVGLWSIRQLGG